MDDELIYIMCILINILLYYCFIIYIMIDFDENDSS